MSVPSMNEDVVMDPGVVKLFFFGRTTLQGLDNGGSSRVAREGEVSGTLCGWIRTDYAGTGYWDGGCFFSCVGMV
jgi:hypothetical protein